MTIHHQLHDNTSILRNALYPIDDYYFNFLFIHPTIV